jgi:hypothetical protein
MLGYTYGRTGRRYTVRTSEHLIDRGGGGGSRDARNQ